MFPTRAEEADNEILSDSCVQARMKRIHNPGAPYNVVHKTLYNVHQRVADTYRVGRILLTGDAAHINNPLGGMGMNGGIHDSFNLSEKLVPVLRDDADPSALDQYNEERRDVAMKYVQRISIQNKKDLESDDPADQTAFRDRLLAAAGDTAKRRELLLRLSMLDGLGGAV